MNAPRSHTSRSRFPKVQVQAQPKSLRERIALEEFEPPKENPLSIQDFQQAEMEGFDHLVGTFQALEADRARRMAQAQSRFKEALQERGSRRDRLHTAFQRACFEDCDMRLEDSAAIKAWEMAKDRGCSKLEILDHFQELADLIKTARCPL